MRKIEPELITGMGYIGDNPGVLYRMGGAGEQTVVTGNPALLEGVKGSRLTSLILHGKSTQGSTTGAQLLDINNLTDAIGYNNTAIVVDGGLSKRNDDVAAPDRYLIDVTPNTIYSISASDFSNGAVVQISDMFQKGESESVVDTRIYEQLKQSEFNSGKYKQLTLSFFSPKLNAEFKAGYIMLNAGDAVLPWEPYTGGAPSPSPSYPQEIESAGMDGEIGVEVLSGNLIKAPFESDTNSYKPGYIFTQNGVTFSVEDDMGIKVSGTNNTTDKYAQFNAHYKTNEFPKYQAGTYTVSDGISFQIRLASGVVNKNNTFTVNEDFESIGFYIAIPAGQTINKTVYPMLNIGSTALPYEPYKPAQTLVIPTPGGLPGIPVSSGGNYTDKDGQQWVADEIDLAMGERVQRIEKLDLKSLLWSKQSRASNASGFWFSSRIKSASLFGANVKGTISNIGRLGNPYNMIGDYVWALTNAGNSEIRIGFADSTIDSLEKLTNLLNSLPEAYAMYCLAEPIRTPLPPETIAAYKSLKTYSPTTTVINDAGAGMIVGYKKVRLRKCGKE